MTQFERGGMNIGRWPADLADTEGDGTVVDDSSLPTDQSQAERERLAALPAHEVDTDDSVGAGLAGSATTATDFGVGAGDQPVPDEDVRDDSTDRGGLPLGGGATDR